jgi:class 3 adenylate cyclase
VAGQLVLPGYAMRSRRGWSGAFRSRLVQAWACSRRLLALLRVGTVSRQVLYKITLLARPGWGHGEHGHVVRSLDEKLNMSAKSRGTAKASAERRQVTVLHVDIVNSTALVDHLDPEAVMAIMQAYLEDCKVIVSRFHGALSAYTGDGFEAYFGYPIGKEDSAANAVYAAIAILEMMTVSIDRLPFECRMGIATGQAVVDQPGISGVGRNVLAFGSVPHLAARLEQSARPNRVLVDRVTKKMCEGRFAFTNIGFLRLKGFNDEFEAWEVQEAFGRAMRFAASELSPFVGRDAEIQLLLSRWQAVRAGFGQVVVLIGEPGIGKSRLAYEQQKLLRTESGATFRFQCLPQFISSPLHPWVHNVKRFASIQQNDTTEESAGKLSRYFAKIGLSSRATSICAKLMGLESIDATTPDHANENMLLAIQNELIAHIVSRAQAGPIFLLVEDVQWIDASTMYLMQALIRAANKQKILILMTSRPEGNPFSAQSNVTSLILPKLDSDSISQLIGKLAAHKHRSLSRQALASIEQRSEGNPLFIEEFTKHYLELEDSAKSDLSKPEKEIPNLLQSLLMARIDRAGEGKKLAQLASVIGSDFNLEILEDLSQEPREEVQQQLSELVNLGILRNADSEKISYQFSHALLKDAIYSSLLRATQRQLHLQIAEYLEGDENSGHKVSAEIIAYHFELGGDNNKAFHSWLNAGQRALQAGATEEAAELLARALKLSSVLEQTMENMESLMQLYSSYGVALNASRGIAANPILYHKKAEELSAKLGHTEMQLEALDWQFGLHFNAGELVSSKAPSERIKEIGYKLNHTIAIASGCQGLGMTQFMLGNFIEARNEFELGLMTGKDSISTIHCFPSMSLSYFAWTLFVLGEDVKAHDCACRAIVSARNESSHAVATALSNCSYVFQCLGDVQKVYETTEELVSHTKKYGEQMYLRRGMIIRSWADCITKQDPGPIADMSSHIDFLLQSREEIETTFLLGLLAETQIRFGLLLDAQVALDRAMELSDRNEERFYLAELYRLKGALAQRGRHGPASGKAEQLRTKAREVANAQNAKAWLQRLSLSF